MIDLCEHHSGSSWNGYGYAVALLIVVVLQTLIQQAFQRLNLLTAVKIKTAMLGLLYKKVIASTCSHYVLFFNNTTKLFYGSVVFVFTMKDSLKPEGIFFIVGGSNIHVL